MSHEVWAVLFFVVSAPFMVLLIAPDRWHDPWMHDHDHPWRVMLPFGSAVAGVGMWVAWVVWALTRG